MKNKMLGRALANGMALVLILPLLSAAAPLTGIELLVARTSVASRPSAGNADHHPSKLAFPADRVEVGLAPLVNRDAAARTQSVYGRLPLSFEANHGQTDSRVKFLSRGGGSTVFLTSTEAVVVLTKPSAKATRSKFALVKPGLTQREKVTRTVVRTRLVGANPAPSVAGLDELPGKVNYFIGNDPAKWRTNVPTYAKVRYENVYRGIDLVYYGNNQRQLEYDFVVRPGADPKAIAVGFQGADKLEVDSQGDLVLHTAAGTIRQRKPAIYQEVDGVRREIAGGYVLKDARRVGFQVAAYDGSRPLVIDPVLVYSTYLGGSDGDIASGIAVDVSGNAYVTGTTVSTDFPTTPGAFDTTFNTIDVFVTKLNAAGSALVYSTYLGGSGPEQGHGIAVDASGNAYVTGFTVSTDFPTTGGAFQTTSGDGFHAFVTKLSTAGSALVYSTYLGGSSGDAGNSIAVDAAGNAYVTGFTNSTNFPTANPIQAAFAGGTSFGDAFVTKLDPTGSALVYSTYLGGSGDIDEGRSIAVDAAGNAYVTGNTGSTDFPTTPGAFQTTFLGGGSFNSDTFVAKLNAAGSALVYSTFLGGSDRDQANSIAVDAAGNAYVTGSTLSIDFPTTPGTFQTTFLGGSDAFVTKLNATGSALVYSTFLGGSSFDNGGGIAVDAAGNAYVTGGTQSTDFPTTPGALGTTLRSGDDQPIVTKLNSAGSALVYSTLLGGSSSDVGVGIAVDPAGNAYVMGRTLSSDFPTTSGAFAATNSGAEDAFVAKISVNTPSGNNVSVPAGSGVTVTFANVSSSGETAATTSSTGPTPPAGFSLEASSYYAITTTATFGPPATICITYVPAQFNDPTTLRLFHFENSAWVDVTTSNDPDAGIICGQTSSLSPFLIAERTSLPVTIDIKPGSYPNTINLGSNGVVPVAILSTPTFDARTVDPTTVTLASAHAKLTGKGKPIASFQDVNGDGRLDLVVQVETSALQLTSTDTVAVLKGKTFSGQLITGTDSVRVVPQ